MYRIVRKAALAPGIHQLEVEAPMVAKAARPGNFVMVRNGESGERIPLTIVSADDKAGTINLVIQEIGKSTMDMGLLKAGDHFIDVVGPLGAPTHIEKVGTVVAVAGGIGVAPVIPQIRQHKAVGNHVITIVGARTRDLLILTDLVEEASHEVMYCTDDGSYGYKGFVTGALDDLLKSGRKVDYAVAIGPLRMMKATAAVTKKYDVPTIVSLNAIMVDGTGMCGCCRVTYAGEIKFSCVDGPEFDAHKVDFDELEARQNFFCAKERVARERFDESRRDCRCQGA